MSDIIYTYDPSDDFIHEHRRRNKKLRHWECASLEEAFHARRGYLNEIAARLDVDKVSLARRDGTEEMVSVPEAAMNRPGLTVADVLLEAVGAIANGTESSASDSAKAVLLAASEVLQRTWTPTDGVHHDREKRGGSVAAAGRTAEKRDGTDHCASDEVTSVTRAAEGCSVCGGERVTCGCPDHDQAKAVLTGKGGLRWVAFCPKSPEHRTFDTIAVVNQDWLVDEVGEWISTIDDCSQIVSRPDRDNQWLCSECGAHAEWKQE